RGAASSGPWTFNAPRGSAGSLRRTAEVLFHRKSLATRASLAVFFLSLVVVILVSFWQLLAEYRKELRQVEQQMVSLEISVANVVSRSLWMYDEEQLQTMLRGLHTLPYVNYA